MSNDSSHKVAYNHMSMPGETVCGEDRTLVHTYITGIRKEPRFMYVMYMCIYFCYKTGFFSDRF